jgi:hypothetical protein
MSREISTGSLLHSDVNMNSGMWVRFPNRSGPMRTRNVERGDKKAINKA